jgi:hypothetical protein
MAGFKSFANASSAIAGIELAHRIRKRQFILGRNRRRRGWSQKHEWAIAPGVEDVPRRISRLDRKTVDAPEPE